MVQTGAVRRRHALLAALMLLAACAGASVVDRDVDGVPGEPGEQTEAAADAQSPETFTHRGETAAPDFPPGLGWFNVDRELSIAQDLRGKIVILDFWTQGCINCIHVIPDLQRLQAEYPESVVIIGVHWAKFDREREMDAVRQSVLRYGIEHPVVNDEFELIRNSYGVRAWPTQVLIDPLGNGVAAHAGEGTYQVMQPVVDVMAREFGAAGLIDATPLDALVASRELVPTVLSFPGKVLADEVGGRLFIADTGHHRILVADLDGRLTDVIGRGGPGRDDGAFEQARFSRPQGMALSEDGTTLYVADRENHLVRSVDLSLRRVGTIAGTGDIALRFSAGEATEVPLASPWDLHLEGDQLFVAGAGRHQLWVIELGSGYVDVFAGTGAEGLDDGPRLQTTMSQPSGLAGDGDSLYVTDPEASAIRRVTFDDGQMTTLVGDGLFSWGDSVGPAANAQVQHPVGIELVGESLYIADTYNHRIKVLHLATSTLRPVAGDGVPGLVDGTGTESRLAEPSGLSAAGRRLYVADTNNHQIRVIDLDTGALTTLALSNLDLATVTEAFRSGDEVRLAQVAIAPGRLRLTVDFDVPDGYKFNDLGTFRFAWSFDDSLIARRVGSDTYEAMGPDLPLQFDIDIEAEAQNPPRRNTLRGEATVFYCRESNEGFCLVRDVLFEVPVEITADGETTIELHHSLPSAEDLEAQLSGG